MKILSRMLSKKDEPENPGAADMELDMDAPSLAPRADDTGEINGVAAAPLPPAADPGHPVMPREEEPEVAGSGWGDAAWDEDDWDDDEDWGDDEDPAARPISADKKALVSEIRDAMVSVNAMRNVSEQPEAPVAQAPVAQAPVAQDKGPDFSEDEEFGRKAKARSELRNNGEEERILQKTDQVMTEEGSSRRRSAMAHLKAAAAATKADRVLRHVVSRDPSADPEEQSPYRDDLAKVVRPQSTSRPISRVVPRAQTRSPIWDQGEGDEDAALYAAAGDGLDADVHDTVGAEMEAAEEQRIARGPMDLSAEDFADDTPNDTARVQSAFPSSPFAREATPSSPVNAFDDLGEEDFEDEFEAEEDFDDPNRFAVDFDEEDDSAPRPSRVVSAAVAFANAPEEVEDMTPPEPEVRKAIWEAAEEVAAEVEVSQPAEEPQFAAPEDEEPASGRGPDDAPEVEAFAEEEAAEEAAPMAGTLDIAAELAAAKAASGVRPPSQPSIPDPDPATPAPSAMRVAPVRPPAPATPAAPQDENFADVSANVPGRAGRSAGRVKTRLLGFQANEEKDVFESAPGASNQTFAQYPSGWIVVTEGPGRGASFTLQMGVSQIGRGEDQTVRLDFGDTSISRNNHAAVAYDDEQGKFFLGHGGKSNLVRLNGMPVLSTEEMNSGDEIRIGETTLKFVALCGAGFVWGDIGETAAE